MNSGFLLINKPLHWTSFDVIAVLRKKLNIKRIGHTGTLDPLATGLMVIGVGEATKFLEFHTGHNKEYIAEITFGAASETYDSEGPLQSTMINDQLSISREDIENTINKHFLGEIEQVPPKYSALKINGEKYCNLVRQGKEVDIEAKKRKITIFENEILRFEYPQLTLRIACSTGTYIRSIAHDLGQALGCGGYLSALHRTQVDIFRVEDAKDPKEIETSDFLALNSGLEFETLNIDESTLKRLQVGQKIEIPNRENAFVKVYKNDTFYGVAEIRDGFLRAKKILVL